MFSDGWAQVNAFGVYQSYYSTHLGESNSTISWIGSFQLWLQFGLGLFAGRLFDAGYCRHMIFGGSLVYVFSLFMVSFSPPLLRWVMNAF